MNIKEIREKLESFGIEDALWEAYLIVERLFGVGRATLLANPTMDFDSSELVSLLSQREKRIPLQYIFGKWEFMGKEFYVSKDCLIPQPDTEILVEKALEIIKKRCLVGQGLAPDEEKAKGEICVADLCTGSGCIGLSLLMYGELESMTLLDISSEALDICKKNAKLHGVAEKCHFILGDVRKTMPQKKFDIIVSNPPYIPTKDIENLPDEVKNEPHLALDGGDDGLDIIRFLIGDGLSYLNENGVMLIEFGYDQGDIMDTLLREKCDTESIKSYEIIKDYGNNPRLCIIYS